LWSDFEAEMQEAHWIYRGVANVRNFESETLLISLGDGVTIRGRSETELAGLGFGPAIWDRIADDWSGFGGSSFVLVAEHSLEKQPDNLILIDGSSLVLKAIRALGALRLARSGSINLGPMWIVRHSRFNVGIGGLHQSGAAIPASGSPYRWHDEIAMQYPPIYNSLGKLEKEGYGRSPGNLAVALRSFMATYDRYPSRADSQLLDVVTAFEALLGTENEIAFKLSFRIAALLGRNDDERSGFLKLIKDFYDTRSRIVHGGELKQKHLDRLANLEELRSILRRLLRSLVEFSVRPPIAYNKAFWEQRLDAALVNTTEREKLRTALRLD
jgi:hypothetical protein